MPLSREEEVVLDAFSDDDMEPLEEVFLALRESGYERTPDEFLELMFQMVRAGFFVVRQIPIMAQTFAERTIEPMIPVDIVGDLAADFGKFCRSGNGAGVPFGIYFVLTELGREGIGPWQAT